MAKIRVNADFDRITNNLPKTRKERRTHAGTHHDKTRTRKEKMRAKMRNAIRNQKEEARAELRAELFLIALMNNEREEEYWYV